VKTKIAELLLFKVDAKQANNLHQKKRKKIF